MFFMRSNYDFKVVHPELMSSAGEGANAILDIILSNKLENVHLVGHSAGGLAARWVASFTEEKPIATITTISTPHHGSVFADKYSTEHPSPDDTKWEKSYKQLTSQAMKEFNIFVPDNPNVKYFSMGFTNDIMVTPESAHWGTYLGSGNCSHLMQTSPWFGGQFQSTFKVVLDNLDSLT